MNNNLFYNNILPLSGINIGGTIDPSTIDHNVLENLTVGNAHPQYFKVDGTNAIEGNINMNNNNIINTDTINGVAIENHASRHLPNGQDPLATTTPVGVNSTNEEGTANSFARSDHVHKGIASIAVNSGIPAYGDINLIPGGIVSISRLNNDITISGAGGGTAAPTTSLSATTTNSAGVATTYSASDHSHAILTGAPSTQTPDQVNATGTSTNLARADHTHNIPTAMPVAVGPLNVHGASSAFARSDHVHQGISGMSINSGTVTYGNINLIPSGTVSLSQVENDITISGAAGATAAPTTNLSATTANTAGVASTYSASDHTHEIITDTVITQIPDQANTSGTSSGLARADHMHNIPTAAPVSIGSANTQGTALTFALSDHVHQGVSGVSVNSGTVTYGNINFLPGGNVSLSQVGNDITITGAAGTTAAPTTNLSATTTNTAGTATTYSASDHTHAILTGTPSTQIPDQTNTTGISPNLARADHTHNIPTAAPVSIGNANAKGTAATFALSDHVHQGVSGVTVNSGVASYGNINLIPGGTVSITKLANDITISGAAGATAAPTTNLSATTTNTAGVASTYSASDHTHAILTGTPSAQTPDQVNAIGISSNLARADHVHNIATAAPVSIGSANAKGTAATFARSDHVHQGISAMAVNSGVSTYGNINLVQAGTVTISRLNNDITISGATGATAAPTTNLSATTTNTAGVASTYSASDHTHAILTDIASTQIPDQVNAAGTSASLARADHIHNIPTASPISIGSSNAQGSAATFARSDHVHQGVSAVTVDSGLATYGNINLISGGTVSLNQIGNNITISGAAGATAAPTTNLSATTTNSAGVASTYSASDHTHAILTGTPSVQFPDQINATGTSARLARADHIHNIPSGMPVTIGSTNAQGTSSAFALSDHVHQGVSSVTINSGLATYGNINLIPSGTVSLNQVGNDITIAGAAGATAAPTTNLSATTSNAAGVASTYSASDHIHAISTGAPSTQIPDQTNTTGTSANLARADHIHNIPTAAPISIGNANAQGTSASFARSDHVHKGLSSMTVNSGIATFGDINLVQAGTVTISRLNNDITISGAAGATAAPTTSLSATTTNTAGVASTYSASDHTHAILTAAPSSQTPDQTNTTGTSSSLSRADHKHNIPTAIPVNIGTATAQGTAASFARSDHVHRGLSSVAVNSGIATYGDINLVQAGTVTISRLNNDITITGSGGATAAPTTSLSATTTNAAGVASTYSASDHTHALLTDIAATQVPDQVNASGTSASLARADHVHNIPTAAPVSIGIANAQGSASTFAKSDHVHRGISSMAVNTGVATYGDINLVQAGTVTISRLNNDITISGAAGATAAPTTSLSATTTNAAGVASTYSASDHTHSILTGTPSAQTPDQTNTAGTSANLARADHVHNIPTAAPVSIGTANTQGTAATFARSDHVHQGLSSVAVNAGVATSGAINLVQAGTVTISRLNNDITISGAAGATAAPTTSLSATTTNTAGAATTYSASNHTHAILTGAPSAQTPDQTNTTGTSANLARADHKHNIPTAVPVAIGAANAQGAAASFARSDHVHQGVSSMAVNAGVATYGAINLVQAGTVTISRLNNDITITGSAGATAAPTTNLSATTTNSAGVATTYSASDHTHAISTDVAVTQTPDQINAAGTSANLARADHVHNIPTAVPVSIGSANTQGAAATFAKSDHVHQGLSSVAVNSGVATYGDINLVQAGTVTISRLNNDITITGSAGAKAAPTTSLSAATTNSAGVASTYSGSDHTHAILTGVPADQLPDQLSSAGTSANLARADHVHTIATATPVAIGSANAQGTANFFARSDHVHQGISAITVNSGAAAYGSINFVSGTNTTVSRSGNNVTIASSISTGTCVLYDVKGTGTGGGTSAATTWNNRVLNTISGTFSPTLDTVTGDFTLPAGTFILLAYAPAYQVNGHQIRLWNTSASGVHVYGMPCYAPNGTSIPTVSMLATTINLGSPLTFRVQHYTALAVTNTGLGLPLGINAQEVYTTVHITKVA